MIEDAFAFIAGVLALALFVLIAVAVVYGIRDEHRFDRQCHSLGGRLIHEYKSSDLCVSTDGRILDSD